MAYTKLDSGITESTIWQAPDATRLVWITMLARADQNGYVGASMPGLAGLARVSLEACIIAIKHLEGPDEWSRTKDHDGRRIAPADGGWVLLNHAKYRAMQNADDRRERSRIAMANLRNKRKQEATVINVNKSCSKLTQAEAEAEYISQPAVAHPPFGGKKAVRFPEFWAAWPAGERKQDKAKCLQYWKRSELDDMADTILADVLAKRGTHKWAEGFIEAPLVYLRGKRWEDGGAEGPQAAVEVIDHRRADTVRLLAEQKAHPATKPPQAVLDLLKSRGVAK